MSPDRFAAEFAAALAAAAARAERALDRLLPPADGPTARLAAAMRYGALGGGKRLRAFLALETAAMLGAPAEAAERLAAALECVHAYSLVHDDLPAMDDDDLRRGRPTAHLAFDEATAILAGDALQSLAFEILAAPETTPDAGRRAELCLRLARAIGFAGMCGGQMLDIAAETAAAPLELAAVERLQAGKTGALIRCAAASGGVLAGASADEVAALDAYAARLGLAFQIRDDLLDVEGAEAVAGKRLRKDAAAGKATFVDLLGVDGARARGRAEVAAATDALARFGAAAGLLRYAAVFALERAA